MPRIAEPCPGDVLVVGPPHVRWIVYELNRGYVAAAYIAGRLVRRDTAGWWTAGFDGDRSSVPDLDVILAAGTAPAGWNVPAEQNALCDVAATLDSIKTTNTSPCVGRPNVIDDIERPTLDGQWSAWVAHRGSA